MISTCPTGYVIRASAGLLGSVAGGAKNNWRGKEKKTLKQIEGLFWKMKHRSRALGGSI